MGAIIKTMTSNGLEKSMGLVSPGFGVLEGIWISNKESMFDIGFSINDYLLIYEINSEEPSLKDPKN